MRAWPGFVLQPQGRRWAGVGAEEGANTADSGGGGRLGKPQALLEARCAVAAPVLCLGGGLRAFQSTAPLLSSPSPAFPVFRGDRVLFSPKGRLDRFPVCNPPPDRCAHQPREGREALGSVIKWVKPMPFPGGEGARGDPAPRVLHGQAGPRGGPDQNRRGVWVLGPGFNAGFLTRDLGQGACAPGPLRRQPLQTHQSAWERSRAVRLLTSGRRCPSSGRGRRGPLFCFSGPCRRARAISVPGPGLEPAPLAGEES